MKIQLKPAPHDYTYVQTKAKDLPSGSVFSLEGQTFLKADTFFFRVEESANTFVAMKDYEQRYVGEKIPTFILGFLRFYPLAF